MLPATVAQSSMTVDEFTLVIGAFLALITVVGSTLWYAHNALRQVEKSCELRIQEVEKSNELRLQAGEGRTQAQLEKEGKARHDLASNIQNTYIEVQRKLELLNTEVIRKSDLANWETRLIQNLSQGEKRRDESFAELRADMKDLTSKVTRLVVFSEIQLNKEESRDALGRS